MDRENIPCSLELYAHNLWALVDKWYKSEVTNCDLFFAIQNLVNNLLAPAFREKDRMMNDKAWQNLRHFNKDEWVKDPDKVSKLLAFEVDDLRERVGRPCYIHVCWDDSGHSENSYHYSGQAVDLHFATSPIKHIFLKEFLAIMQSNQFNGIGFYPAWTPRPGWHVDVRQRDEKLLWTRVNGEYRYGVDAILDALLLFP